MNEWPAPARKSKWIAGGTAFFVPGTGHFYLGQMTKGIVIMLLLAVDICAIIFAAEYLENILAITLFALMLPIIYFYSLFDAIQSVDAINERTNYALWQAQMQAQTYGMAPQSPPYPSSASDGVTFAGAPAMPFDDATRPSDPQPDSSAEQPRMSAVGSPVRPMPQIQSMKAVIILAVIVAVLLVMSMGWSGWVMKSSESMVGAGILIAAGIGLWFWEMRKDRGRRSS